MRPLNQPTIAPCERTSATRMGSLLASIFSKASARLCQELLDLLVGELGSEISTLHCIAWLAVPADGYLPRLLEVAMPDELRDTERAAGIAGGRLNPDLLERPFAQQAAVADAVERDAARHAQRLGAGFLLRGPGHAEHDLFAHDLDTTVPDPSPSGSDPSPAPAAARRTVR